MRTYILLGIILMFMSVANAAQNLIELHKKAGSMSNKDCLKCHAKILKEETLDKKHKTFHRVHLESKKDTPKECVDCHEKIVDLREGSAGALRKQVDPQVCEACHSGGDEDAKQLYGEEKK